MATDKIPGAKRGRPPKPPKPKRTRGRPTLTPQTDKDAALKARVLASVADRRNDGWILGDGWSSSPFSAVRHVYEANGFNVPTQAGKGTLPNANGLHVQATSRSKNIATSIERLEPAVRAYFEDASAPAARIPTMAVCIAVADRLHRREPCKDNFEALVRISVTANVLVLLRHHDSGRKCVSEQTVDELLWTCAALEREFPDLKGATSAAISEMQKAIAGRRFR